VLLALNVAIFAIRRCSSSSAWINGVPICDYTPTWARRITRRQDRREVLPISDRDVPAAAGCTSLQRLGALRAGARGHGSGTLRFVALYLIAGWPRHHTCSAAPSVGASARSSVGGLAAFYYVSRKLLGEASRRQLGNLITVVMIACSCFQHAADQQLGPSAG
jgi:hypothetical protein